MLISERHNIGFLKCWRVNHQKPAHITCYYNPMNQAARQDDEIVLGRVFACAIPVFHVAFPLYDPERLLAVVMKVILRFRAAFEFA